MRFPTRLSAGLFAIALAAPATPAAFAQQAGGYAPLPITLEQAQQGYQPGMAAPAPAAVAPASEAKHSHKGLMGWRHCVECQRARAKAESGVDVPPPPSAGPQGAMIPQGAIIHQGHTHHDHVQATGPAGCAACEAGAVVVGPVTVTETYPAGHAVANGMMTAAGSPIGRAVVGGADPTPVGVSRAGQGNFTPYNAVAAAGPAPGPRDPSVMPTSMIPPQTALSGPTGARPRIISHLLGLPDLRRIRRDMDAHKSREPHASISYQENAAPVNELPASMVYGKGH